MPHDSLGSREQQTASAPPTHAIQITSQNGSTTSLNEDNSFEKSATMRVSKSTESINQRVTLTTMKKKDGDDGDAFYEIPHNTYTDESDQGMLFFFCYLFIYLFIS